MKMPRALICAILILATVSAVSAQKTTAPAKEKIVWVAYGYLAQNKADRIIAEFTAKYPQYEVEYVDLGSKDYLMRLDTMITSGERVDVALAMDSIEYTNRASEGMFLPIDKLVTEDGFNLQDAFGDGLQPSYINGKLYGLPYTKGGFYVFYNKNMFDAAGLKYPTDDWTWEDFERTAKALTTGSGSKKIYGANIHLTWGYDIDTLPAQMAGWFPFKDEKQTVPNLDDPKLEKALALWNRLQNIDKTAMALSTFKAEQIGSRVPFAKGQAAMLLSNWWSASWFINSKFGSAEGASMLNFKLGVANVPRPDKSVPANLNATDLDYYFAVPRTSKNAKGGALLARFMITDMWSKLGTLSSYRKQDLKTFKASFDTYIDASGKKFDMGYPDELVEKVMGNWTVPINIHFRNPRILNPVGLAVIKDIFNQERELYYLGEQDLAKTVSRMQSRALAEMKAKK